MPRIAPVILTIAGFDPSSGAGVTADVKTIAAHGCYGVACITALTVQSTAGVRNVQPVSAKLVTETLNELSSDVEFASIHVGMLGSEAVAEAVALFVAEGRYRNIVLDPVLKSTSGASLLDALGLVVLIEKLIPVATVVTPNLAEAAILAKMVVETQEDMRVAAAKIQEMGAAAVVITGGHLEEPSDLLSFKGERGAEQRFFKGERLQSTSTHGTGCAFSTSLTCSLAKGMRLPEAVSFAGSYVRAAIASANPLGKGIGPVDHLYRLHQE
jgi:hydroxymethylpyrimidine/phosphomethylpyrimidine kinase